MGPFDPHHIVLETSSDDVMHIFVAKPIYAARLNYAITALYATKQRAARHPPPPGILAGDNTARGSDRGVSGAVTDAVNRQPSSDAVATNIGAALTNSDAPAVLCGSRA